VKIFDANVVQTDLEATNGVIHVIDQVLVPEGVDVAALLATATATAATATATDATATTTSAAGLF